MQYSEANTLTARHSYVLTNTRVRFIGSGLLTLYDLSYSKFKLEGFTTITRGVEFLPIGQCACEQCEWGWSGDGVQEDDNRSI